MFGTDSFKHVQKTVNDVVTVVATSNTRNSLLRSNACGRCINYYNFIKTLVYIFEV